MAVRKIKLTVRYDGFDYHGWQIQPGKKTIQGALVEAVSNLVGQRTFVHGASRTDAGVSALGQAALFEIDSPIPTENFADAINDRLSDDIVITEATEASREFDLISGPTSKLYRYSIYTGKVRPVMHIRHCWHLPGELDLAAINEAAKLLVGTKDFKSFASGKDKREDTVRTIFRCEVYSSSEERLTAENAGENITSPKRKRRDKSPPSRSGLVAASSNLVVKENPHNARYEDTWVYVDVEGDGFLYNMVRNIVGTLVEVGAGRWGAEKINEILEAKDRTAAGPLAPANGLCLMWIKYD